MYAMRIPWLSQPIRRLTQAGGVSLVLIGVHASCSSISAQPDRNPEESKAIKKAFPLRFETAKSSNVIFNKNETRNTISVNIGDYNAYVGSRGIDADTINNAFDQMLRDAGQNTENYQYAHLHIDKVERINKVTEIENLVTKSQHNMSNEIWKIQMGMAPNPAKEFGDLNFLEKHVPFLKRIFHRGILTFSPMGSVFVDVWKPEFAPHGNPKNMGMMYVIGPQCEENEIENISKRDFLLMVCEISKSMVKSLNAYNQKYPAEKIEVARIRLAPADIYHHPETTKQEVADWFFRGMMQVLKENSAELRFEYNEGVFRIAFENWLRRNSQ